MSRKKIENSERKGVSAKVFSRAVDALKRGEVIVFPTETFYGLGADAFNETAVEQVVFLKGRKRENPIPIIIPCHRVVAKKGIGGYSAGIDIKTRLLELEKRNVNNL